MAERHDFADRSELAKALAAAVADKIAAAIESTGAAVIAVSGGTTPAKFFTALGKHKELDWDKVWVTLVDERWVDRNLVSLQCAAGQREDAAGPGGDRAFRAALYRRRRAGRSGDRPRRQAAGPTCRIRLPRSCWAWAMTGHTASFFPGGDTLSAALTGAGPVLAIHAPGAGEARVTQTLNRLLDTSGLYLHIEGEEKADTLAKALGEGPVEDMPVRAVLRQGVTPLEIYWAP